MPILQVMNIKSIHRDITIADLTEQFPESVGYLSERGIRCLRCGEPIWGTLAEAAQEKGFSETQIKQIVDVLNARCSGFNPQEKSKTQ